jgi:tetratricopeptide (TPR) repeat protein
MAAMSVADGGVIGTASSRRVFLSHTSDLRDHPSGRSFVAAAVDAVLRAEHTVIDMNYFTASNTSPADHCIAMLARANVYVGIIGLRYGATIPDRPGLSYTEVELEAATAQGLPRLIFLIRGSSPHLPAFSQSAEHDARQEALRSRLQRIGLTVAWVDSPLELEVRLYQALIELNPAWRTATRPAEAETSLASVPTDVLPPHGSLPAGSHMPLHPNPLFVGRDQELLHLASALSGADRTVSLGQVVASTGLGGLGKTQLAVEFVHRYGRFFAGGVYWFSFASAEEIPLQVAACAGPDADGMSLEKRLKVVHDAWQSPVPRLLVFDNCEDETLLDAWRPSSGGCRLLVTSRRSHWSPTLGVHVLPLDLLPRTDSIELLCRYRPEVAIDDPGLQAIAHQLGDLPLALHLAGSYLRTYSVETSLEEYLIELSQPAIVHHASLLGKGLEDSPSPTRHVQSLAQTFAVCLARLDNEHEEDRTAIALLVRMACLAPGEAVPRDLLNRTLQSASAMLRADGLRRLRAVGLVQVGHGWLRMHRLLVHFVRQEGLDPNAQAAVDVAVMTCGTDAEEGRLTGPALAGVIPHLIDVASGDTNDELRMAERCNAAGVALHYTGDLGAARPWLTRAVQIRERMLGQNHPHTATSITKLAVLLWAQGELDSARSLNERALAIREGTLGPDDPAIAESLYNLAGLLRIQGEPGMARPLLERALAIQECTLEPNHPAIAFSLDNLASILRLQGESSAARKLLERALAIRERALGREHPTTAASLHHLAVVLQHQGEIAAARALHERALAMREHVLGSDHPATASSLNYLGVLLLEQNELSAAMPLLQRALTIRERTLGSDHPLTATSSNSLALLLQAAGDLTSAQLLLRRALTIRERTLGFDHPDTATTRLSLTRTFQ